MKVLLIGMFLFAAGVSTVFGGQVKIVEREDVVVVEYTGDGTGEASDAEELEMAAEEGFRAKVNEAKAKTGAQRKAVALKVGSRGEPPRGVAVHRP